MFEKFLSGNADNFRQRYEGTYGFYKVGDKRMLVRLTQISDNRCDFIDEKNIEWNVRADHPDNVGFEFLPPRSQWYNTKDGAMFTHRIANRQFQRGVCGKTLSISVLRGGTMMPARVDFSSLTAIYRDNISVQEALKLGDEKSYSFAISPLFSLDPYNHQVRLYEEGIGSYSKSGKKFSFKLNEPQLWRTEITDALRAVGYTAEIN